MTEMNGPQKYLSAVGGRQLRQELKMLDYLILRVAFQEMPSSSPHKSDCV